MVIQMLLSSKSGAADIANKVTRLNVHGAFVAHEMVLLAKGISALITGEGSNALVHGKRVFLQVKLAGEVTVTGLAREGLCMSGANVVLALVTISEASGTMCAGEGRALTARDLGGRRGWVRGAHVRL